MVAPPMQFALGEVTRFVCGFMVCERDAPHLLFRSTPLTKGAPPKKY